MVRSRNRSNTPDGRLFGPFYLEIVAKKSPAPTETLTPLRQTASRIHLRLGYGNVGIGNESICTNIVLEVRRSDQGTRVHLSLYRGDIGVGDTLVEGHIANEKAHRAGGISYVGVI